MDAQAPGLDDSTSVDSIVAVKATRQELETRITSRREELQELIASIQTLVPDLVSSLNLSLQIVSTFNNRPFTPLSPIPNPNPTRPHKKPAEAHQHHHLSSADHHDTDTKLASLRHGGAKSATQTGANRPNGKPFRGADDSGGPLSVVRSMVATCLLERVPFAPIDSSTVLRKLENDQTATPAQKAALREVGGHSGILAVEMALRSMAEDNGGVELEEFVVSGKSRVMVMSIDRTRLLKEFPESSQLQQLLEPSSGDIGGAGAGCSSGGSVSGASDVNGSHFGQGSSKPQIQETWPSIFPGQQGAGGMMGPRGGPRGMGIMGMPRPMALLPPQHRPPMGPMSGSSAASPIKQKSEEDVMKDLELLLNKKSFKELQKSKTGEELLDLIHRPTARESAVAAKFKTKGGSQLKEYCSALTKEDCRQKAGSYLACEKVHFRRIIAPHTDVNLGDCSFLDTCRHMKTCKYVHYELDPTPDIWPNSGAPPLPLKTQRPEYCSAVELGESQWINCDIRNFRMDILGQFGVIMADPPWDIHMELPYGTMADDEMRTLNVPALQTDGLIFLWVTGRAMELGRECLELWGYKRVEEIIWVKTNQLQRIIRTGRTGHWLNHSKEHCLVGIKGSPIVNRNIDTDVVVAEVRETSRKPDEMYPLLERISPRTRKLELFARMHNTHSGWLSLGNQLNGVRLVDEGLRARFKAAYPDVEIQPPSPPRPSSSASAMDLDGEPNNNKSTTPFSQPQSSGQGPTAFTSEEKPRSGNMHDIEMAD